MSSFFKSVRNNVFMIFCFLFPILNCRRANKILDKNIQSLENGEINFEYMAGWDTLTLEEVQEFYNNSFEQMKSLESKARISIVGLTIAVSLMIGIGGSLLGNEELSDSQLQLWVTAFGIISLSYFIMSGCMSLEVLGGRNKVYQLFPKQLRLPEKDKIEKIAFNTELNVYLNIIRNNYVYSAYRSILYAIVSLGIMFILFTVSVL